MRRRRPLSVKIFGWFWLTLTVGTLAVLLLTLSFGSRPLGQRWMHVGQDLYARSAVDFYVTGGAPSLERYLAELRSTSEFDARLLEDHHDGKGMRDVQGKPLPPDVGWVLAQTERTGRPALHLGRMWAAASPVQASGRSFVFVFEVDPSHPFLNGTFAGPVALRLLVALLVAAGFCLLLARHIVAPIRTLQAAALRLAGGDLATRALPSIAPRNDELTDMARAFDEMAQRIQTLLLTRQQLLADISHELRSPLTRLSISLELMRRGEPDLLEQMQLDLDRMNAMIGDILLLTRLDLQPDLLSGQADATPVDLNVMLEVIVADAAFEGQPAHKTIRLHAPTMCALRGDPNLLRSCIENVVRNAVHYTAPDTAVEIHLEALPTLCRIQVTDNGPGVPAASLPLLFDPFYRVSTSRDRSEGGTGLGLSISQRVVQLHGGTLTAENRVETTGLRITMELPTR